MTRKVIFDTDPGIDDALALLLLAVSPEIELLGITVTHGNTSQEKCLRNALSLVELSGMTHIDVARGAEEPLIKELSVAEETHGDGGLGYASLPKAKKVPSRVAAHDFIIQQVEKYPGEITILAVGPMTNVALALLKRPEIAKKINSIISMGGAIHYPGNATPQAEYNVFCDPEAFEIVLRSGIDFTLVPLDVTYKCIFTKSHLEKIDRARPEIKEFITESTRFYMEFHVKHQSIEGCAINDPLAAALLIDPNLVKYEDYFVRVDLTAPTSKAKTIADYYGALNQKSNAHVAMQVDVEKFMDLFVERMNRFQ
ncbi:MAG: nucleoside hydrolase [Actinobacteria bacterium]|nr:nucleoside hydrolase [Actinomycetota bacterium]